MRAATVLCAIGCSAGAVCQVRIIPPAAVPEVVQYEAFFRELAPGPGPGYSQPAVPESAGFTDAEKFTLSAIAIEWESKYRRVNSEYGQVVFESRLHFIQSGEADDGLAARLKILEGQRSQITADHVQRLKDALGEIGVAKVGAYFRERQAVLKPVAAPSRKK
jgi:hypothetical protein